MNIRETIETVDKMRPNQFSDSDKIRWLNELDGMVKKEIIDTHDGADLVTFTGYDEDTDQDTELLVGDSYTDLYLLFLMSKIDFFNAEYTRYNNDVSMFENRYSEYSAYYNRTHMPIQKCSIPL